MVAMNRSVRKLGKGGRKEHFPDLLEMPCLGKKAFSIPLFVSLCIYAERGRDRKREITRDWCTRLWEVMN